MHEVAERHETPWNCAPAAPLGKARDFWDHEGVAGLVEALAALPPTRLRDTPRVRRTTPLASFVRKATGYTLRKRAKDLACSVLSPYVAH